MSIETCKTKKHADQSHLIGELLEVIEFTVEVCTGISVGTFVGWLFGLCAGNIYVRHFQPVYVSAYSSLSEITEWTFKPGIMANRGAYIGAAAGATIVLVIWGVLLCRKG